MTLVQFASLWNLTAVSIVLGLSWTVLQRYPTPYFKAWTISYVCVFASICFELFAAIAGRYPLLSALEIGVVSLNIALLLVTGRRLPVPRHVPMPIWALVGLVTVLSLGALAAGRSFPEAAIGIMLGLSASATWLGIGLFKQPGTSGSIDLRWIGGPLIAVGLVPLAFPLLGDTGNAWAGYWAGGVLHLMVGVGMVLVVIESVSAELRDKNVELGEKNTELEELDRLKSSFISTVSHELRTPLATIKAASWMIADGRGPSSRELADSITEHVDVLSQLVEDLLDYSRIEADEMRYERQPENLTRLVEDAARGLQPLFGQKGLTLMLTCPDSPLQAFVDGPRIGQVLRNLMVNALKFTPPGGRVTVRLDEVGENACITVTDTGIGIPSESYGAIFTKFFQVDGSATRRSGGTGLGLAICKAITEAHGGYIEVESTVGVGSIFRVHLPLEASEGTTTVASRLEARP